MFAHRRLSLLPDLRTHFDTFPLPLPSPRFDQATDSLLTRRACDRMKVVSYGTCERLAFFSRWVYNPG